MTLLGHRELGTSGLVISELCLGTVAFGTETAEGDAIAIINDFLDAGGNVLDTADVYGQGRSEEIIGKAVSGRRDSIVVATKGGMQIGTDPAASGSSRRHLTTAIESSLRRLGTDWIDLYQLHLPDALTTPEETLRALDDAVQAGKLRFIGASNYAGWQLARALGISDGLHLVRFVSLEAQYSLVSRDVELDLVPLCDAEGVGVMAWGSLGGGILTAKYDANVPPAAGTRLADAPATAHPLNRRTQPIIDTVRSVAEAIGRTPAQVALKWVVGRPRVATAIVSARTRDQLKDNIGVAGWELPAEHRRDLERVSRPRLTYPHDLHRLLGCAPKLG